MKKTILLLCSFVFALSLAAQQIPFQGNLNENGVAVTGTRTFDIDLSYDGINTIWAETQTVSVSNGLYTVVLGNDLQNPLPPSLFDVQSTVLLDINVNGQALPTTTIYAPIESDPTVPSNLKDGVDWTEVENKPALDESSTNELQTLSRNGDSLSISGGNTVAISTSNAGDSLFVGSVDTVMLTALEQLTFDGTSTRNFLWQSFSIDQDAKLKAVEVEFANSTNVDVRFRLYPGEGVNQQSIWSNDFSANAYGPTLEIQAFPISDFIDVDLVAGTVYTFYVQGIGDDLLFRKNGTNPYPFGTTNINSTTDGIFRIIVETVEGFTFEVEPTQTTIRTPLRVENRIKDQTGYVMPVGTILSYASASTPEGFLFCDGSEVSRTLYPDLFASIGTAWGAGDGTNTFHLPDLRGQFLRGFADTTSVDPDKLDRISKYIGGNTGNNVGSYQEDEVKPHSHKYGAWYGRNEPDGTGGLGGGSLVNYSTERDTDPSEGSETRPKNAYVNYIIKY